MSYENFITKLLNIKPYDLLSVMSSSAKDGSIILKVRLKPKECYCHICNIPGKTHGYYQRKLTHSTLVNRQCIIIYEQRRYKCSECGSTFSERNPFIDTSERVTYETKINVLKDLKQPENTYTSIAQKYNLSATKVTRIFDKHVTIKKVYGKNEKSLIFTIYHKIRQSKTTELLKPNHNFCRSETTKSVKA